MMKKLTILFCIIFWFTNAKAQFPYKQSLGNSSTLVYSKGGLGADSTLVFINAFTDTTAANLGFLDGIAGAMIRTSDNNVWMRNNAATAWTQINGSGSGVTTMGAIGSSPNANGATISGVTLTLQPASVSFGGLVTTGTQSFAGTKTFSNDVTLNGNVSFTGTVNSSLTGSNARIPSHTASNITFTNASLISIGSANNGGVADGHVLLLSNNTGNSITVVNNYGGAAAGEVIYTGSGADITIINHASFWLQYNTNMSAWVYIGSSSSGTGSVSRIGTRDSLAKVANGMQISNVSIIPQSSDSTYPGLLKNTDYNRSYKFKQTYNPTGTVTVNVDSAGQATWYLTSTGGRTLAYSNLRRGDIFVHTFNNTSGSSIVLTLPANAFVNLTSSLTATIPTGLSTLSLYNYDGTNYYYSQTSNLSATFFQQNGNAFGAAANLGTTDNNILTFLINGTSRITINTTAARRFQLGGLSNNPTATPEGMSLGGDYNNTLGAIPKFKIFDDGTNMAGIGFGSSGNVEMSFYNSSNTYHFSWYGASTRAFDITPSSSRVLIGPAGTSSAISTPWFLGFNTDFAQSPLTGLKIKLVDNNGTNDFGFGISSGQINYVAPLTNKHSFYNNGVKQVNIGSAQVSFTNNVYVGDSTTTANSTLQVGGSFATRYDSTAVGLTLNATHHTMGVTATGQTITLPTAASIAGRTYTIKLTATGSCTIATTSSQLIDGATTYSLASQYKYVTVQSTGANWVVVANN